VQTLDGEAVLVTGASAGIGAATALALATRGARLGLAARRKELLDEVAERCRAAGSPDVRVYPADLADVDAAGDLASTADRDFAGLGGVVNNAGIPKRLNVAKLPYADVELVTRVNYLSPVRIMLTIIPRMVDRGRGVVVNVGSMAGRIPSPQEAAYTGSKHALTGFSEVAQVDLAGTGVVVRMVQPGPIDTPIWGEFEGNDPPLYDGPKYPPEDVAAVIVEALTGERFEYFVPADMAVMASFMHQDIDTFLDGMASYTRTNALPDAMRSAIPDSLSGGSS
jgi:short-subunit dehydrogenase